MYSSALRGLSNQGTIPEHRELLQTSLAQLRKDYGKSETVRDCLYRFGGQGDKGGFFFK